MKFLKYFWLSTAIIGALWALYFVYLQKWEDVLYFTVLSVAGILFYNIRSKQLNKMKENESKK